ncbi:MAG: hypothetical protein LQ350_000702 [Teloschistes chrysophthalmus]|nr:MAG: hypothetical protein LQ350_000702 [Niorma chrysophthalma]
MSTYGRHFTQTIPKGRSSTEIMGHILIEQRASPAGLEKTNKDLVEQLGKRDYTLQEAFGLINTLEIEADHHSSRMSDDYSDRFIEDMSLCSDFDPDKAYDLEEMGRSSLFFPLPTLSGSPEQLAREYEISRNRPEQRTSYGAAINPTGSVLSLRTTNNFETSKAASDYYAAYCALSSTGSKTTEINPNTNTVNPKTGTTTSLPPFPLLSRIPRRQQQFPATTQLYPKIVRESDASTTNQLPPLHTNTMTLSSFLVNANQGFTNERTSERVRSPNSPAPITQDLYEQPTTTGNVARRRSCWANFQ